jgi:hypothetical protein
MNDQNKSTEDEVRRLIIRGDGSFTVDPKGDWVSVRHYDRVLNTVLEREAMLAKAAIEIMELQTENRRLRATLEAIAAFPVGEFRPLADEIAIHKQAADALKHPDVPAERHGS